jgi:hypothetical protein
MIRFTSYRTLGQGRCRSAYDQVGATNGVSVLVEIKSEYFKSPGKMPFVAASTIAGFSTRVSTLKRLPFESLKLT